MAGACGGSGARFWTPRGRNRTHPLAEGFCVARAVACASFVSWVSWVHMVRGFSWGRGFSWVHMSWFRGRGVVFRGFVGSWVFVASWFHTSWVRGRAVVVSWVSWVRGFFVGSCVLGFEFVGSYMCRGFARAWVPFAFLSLFFLLFFASCVRSWCPPWFSGFVARTDLTHPSRRQQARPTSRPM